MSSNGGMSVASALAAAVISVVPALSLGDDAANACKAQQSGQCDLTPNMLKRHDRAKSGAFFQNAAIARLPLTPQQEAIKANLVTVMKAERFDVAQFYQFLFSTKMNDEVGLIVVGNDAKRREALADAAAEFVIAYNMAQGQRIEQETAKAAGVRQDTKANEIQYSPDNYIVDAVYVVTAGKAGDKPVMDIRNKSLDAGPQSDGTVIFFYKGVVEARDRKGEILRLQPEQQKDDSGKPLFYANGVPAYVFSTNDKKRLIQLIADTRAGYHAALKSNPSLKNSVQKTAVDRGDGSSGKGTFGGNASAAIGLPDVLAGVG